MQQGEKDFSIVVSSSSEFEHNHHATTIRMRHSALHDDEHHDQDVQEHLHERDGDHRQRNNGGSRMTSMAPLELDDDGDDFSRIKGFRRYRDHPNSVSSSGKQQKDEDYVLDEDDGALGDPFDDGTAETSKDGFKREEQTLYPIEMGGSLSHSDRGMRGRIEDWLYPPHLPPSCQLLRKENVAVPLCYLLVGTLQGLSSPLVNVLPLDLGATEAQQTTVSAIRSLPASFKLLFGFWSDNVPIGGLRRKPYMLLGWLMASLSMQVLLWVSNLHVPSRNAGCFGRSTSDHSSAVAKAGGSGDDGGSMNNGTLANGADAVVFVPDDAPSIQLFSVALLCFGIGFWLADVMGDSIVAEKAKLEPPHARGSVQSSCYSYRFFGLMVSAPFSTYLYSTRGPEAVVRLLALLPLAIIPFVYLLAEPALLDGIRSTREQCAEIWDTVCCRSVWQPMGFVYLYNVMQVSNSAWREYLVTVLDFTSCQLNLILIVAYVLLYAGILCYRHYMITWSWRKVYISTTLLNGFFSIGQVLLIHGITFGLTPFLFALGDDAFAEFIAGIQFLPTTIMMVHLCPSGSEGASYAMFTTVNNSALTLSSALSTRLLGLWRVDKATLASGDLSGMLKLTYLTTALQVSAVFFVGLLPHYKEDMVALRDSHMGTSRFGGLVFLAVTFGSILYAVGVGVLNIVAPGWMGES